MPEFGTDWDRVRRIEKGVVDLNKDSREVN